MDIMPTTSFTTRIDQDLKARLEQVAKYENRSASFVANQAIQTLVEEREQTRNLVEVGLQLVEHEQGMISKEAVDTWLRAGDDEPFPEPDTGNTATS